MVTIHKVKGLDLMSYVYHPSGTVHGLMLNEFVWYLLKLIW